MTIHEGSADSYSLFIFPKKLKRTSSFPLNYEKVKLNKYFLQFFSFHWITVSYPNILESQLYRHIWDGAE